MNIDKSGQNLDKKNSLTFKNTNSRLLCPKIESLIDCYEELEVDVGIITETWFKDGPELDQSLMDLELGAGINREANPSTGVAHGGVAVLYKNKIGSFKKLDYPNPENFEVLPVVGSLKGQSKLHRPEGRCLPGSHRESD